MVQLALDLHPGSTCQAVDTVEVAAERQGDILRLRYLVTGRTGDVRIPPTAAAERTDGLWRHTCFEAFVRAPGEDGYVELNLAPSTAWAAYGFEFYREGGRDLDIAPPRIELNRSADRLELLADIGLTVRPPWQVALAVVIEENSGRRSWWAARHPSASPDFHHPDSFVCEIP